MHPKNLKTLFSKLTSKTKKEEQKKLTIHHNDDTNSIKSISSFVEADDKISILETGIESWTLNSDGFYDPASIVAHFVDDRTAAFLFQGIMDHEDLTGNTKDDIFL